MSENKKFDGYIKGLFEEDPEIPSELSWEAMDFDLPNAKVDKQSNRRYLLLLLLLLFLISTALVYVGSYGNEEVKALLSRPSPTQASDKMEKPHTEEQISIHHTEELSVPANGEERSKALNSPSIESTKTFITTQENKPSNFRNSAKNLARNSTSKKVISANDQVEDQINSIEKTPEGIGTNINNESTKIASSFSSKLATNLYQDLARQTVQTFSSIPLSKLNLLAPKELALALKPSLRTPNHVNKKFGIEAVFFGYGYNSFDLSIEESSSLKNKLNSVLSQSYKAGVRLHLTNKWKMNIMLRYDRFHSTLEYTRDLEPRIDAARLIKIYRKEMIFNNNYTNTIALQAGVERNFHLFNRLNLYGGIGLAPTYTMSSTGKTTDDLTLSALMDDRQVNKLSLSGALSAGVVFPINRSINLELAYQFNKFIGSEIFINNGSSTTQQSSLSLMISYRLMK